MSDDDVEYAAEFRAAQRFDTTSRHAELARRKARREAVADHVREQRAERQAAQERADRALRRPLTDADVRIHDQYTRFVDDANKATSREIRQRDLRMQRMDQVLKHDFDGYMQHLSDQQLEMQGFKRPRYKGN